MTDPADNRGNPDAKREDDISIGWGPVQLHATGKSVTIVVLVAALAGLVIWHDTKTDQASTRINDAFGELQYIMSLPEAQRPNLTMPESLRQKLRDQERAKREAAAK